MHAPSCLTNTMSSVVQVQNALHCRKGLGGPLLALSMPQRRVGSRTSRTVSELSCRVPMAASALLIYHSVAAGHQQCTVSMNYTSCLDLGTSRLLKVPYSMHFQAFNLDAVIPLCE